MRQPFPDQVPHRDQVAHDDQMEAAQLEVEQLRQALGAHAVVDQARGILMTVHAIDADEAWSLLADVSSRCNVKVRRLSEALLCMASGAGTPDAEAAAVVIHHLLRPAAGDRAVAELVAALIRRSG